MPAKQCQGVKKYCERGATGPRDVMWSSFKNCPITCGLNCGKLRTKTTFYFFYQFYSAFLMLLTVFRIFNVYIYLIFPGLYIDNSIFMLMK